MHIDYKKIFISLIMKDLKIYSRTINDFMNMIVFMISIIILFPIAMGPAPEKLAFASNAIVWIALIISIIPTIEKIYMNDFKSGWLEQFYYSPLILEIIILIKCFIFWFFLIIPITFFVPIFSILLSVEIKIIYWNLVIFLIGSLSFCLIGSICSSLTLGSKSVSLISPLLILPLTIPIFIFGIGVIDAVKSNYDPFPNLFLLITICLLMLIISPLISAYSIRIALSK